MPFGPRRGWSKHLRGEQARELAEASDYADEIGRPLTCCIDVNWSRTSAGDDPSGRLLAAFRQRLARWLRCRREELYAIFVRERPDGSCGPNDHLHIYLPAHLEEALRHAAPKLLGQAVIPLDEKAVKLHRMNLTWAAREGRLAYIRKGTAPKAAHLLGIRPSDQGLVTGKRCGVTENLGPTARARGRALRAASAAASSKAA